MTSNRGKLIGLASLGVLLLPLIVIAQPESSTETRERRSPLPNYFGKIAVSDEQRVKLYAIQDDYGEKIDALQQQIRMLIRERDGKMEELLTDGQKLRLKELREEARKKAAKPENESGIATESNGDSGR